MHPQSTFAPRDAARFWPKVDRSGDCWLWTAYRDPHGYGRFQSGGSILKAHRVSWELAYGPIPDGLHVLHHCDRRNCVRPEHLFLGGHADNMQDMAAKGRSASGDHHGSHLHPETVCRGEACPQAKLTEAQAGEIRALYSAGGVTQRELGTRFGINQSNVSRIVHGKRWAL